MIDILILLKIVFLILQSLLKLYFITQFTCMSYYKFYSETTFDIIIAYLVCTVPKAGVPYNLRRVPKKSTMNRYPLKNPE